MGYRVSKLKTDRQPNFKLRFETIKNGVRSSRDIPKNEWPNHGFELTMSIENAKAKVRSLNDETHLKRHQERRNQIAIRMKEEELAQSAFLPEVLTKEFEKKLFERRHKLGKLPSYWKIAKQTICNLKLGPQDWADEKEKFYDYFSAKELSLSYVQKLITIINKYGSFYSRKHKQFFELVPFPKGIERGRIATANHSAKGRGNKESAPLTPEMLESKASGLRPEHYNWLFISMWLGLRPEEVDSLKDLKNFEIKPHGDISTISVFQTKLVALSPDKRWKIIPCFLQEQMQALKFIQFGKFKRPLSKSVASWFNEKVGLYGGRKGFTDLMQSKGQSLEDISVWLGHTSIDRTWKNYKNKQRVSFKKPA